jgi:hypothetical protein
MSKNRVKYGVQSVVRGKKWKEVIYYAAGIPRNGNIA